jgi:hypothetical protein
MPKIYSVVRRAAAASQLFTARMKTPVIVGIELHSSGRPHLSQCQVSSPNVFVLIGRGGLSDIG